MTARAFLGGVRVELQPGEACRPADGIYRHLERLRRAQLEDLLIDIAVWHPEVFEEALLNVNPVVTAG